MSRPDVVAALVAGIGEMDPDGFGRLLETASPEEVHEAVIRLREAVLSSARPVPDVLELNLWTVAKLIMQGRALQDVTESLPTWRSWPDKPMSDQLKIAPLEKVAYIRDALHRAGLDIELVGPVDEDEPSP